MPELIHVLGSALALSQRDMHALGVQYVLRPAAASV